MVCGEDHAHASGRAPANGTMLLNRAGLQWQLIALWIAVAVFVAVQAATLTDGHNWGSDFGQYIIHAKNLIEGRDYRHGIWMDENVLSSEVGQTYPIGFPAILAPVVLVFGVDFPVLKATNIVFWALWVLVMHRMIRRRAGEGVALWCSFFLLSSPWFFTFKHNVISDVPFLFFTTLALALYEDSIRDGSRLGGLRFVATLAAAAAAMATRTAGLAFFVAITIHLAVSRREFGRALIALGVPVCMRIVEWSLDIHDSGYVSRFVTPWDGLAQFARTVLDQTFYSLVMLGKVYAPYRPPPTLHALVVALSAVMLSVILVMRLAKLQVLRGADRLARIELIDIFFIVYLGMLAVYDQKQGPRFVLPIAAVVLIYAVEALLKIADRTWPPRRARAVVAAVFAVGVIHNVIATAMVWEFDDDEIHRSPAIELMAWIRGTVGENEHYMFYKSRAAALLTGRTGIFLPEKPEDVLAECRKRGVRWVIFSDNWDRERIDRLRSSPEVREVWRNAEFHAFEVLPAPAPPR